MLKRWIIPLLIAVVPPLVVLSLLQRPPSTEECGDYYRRYESSEHIRTAFLHNYRVNDTLYLDVTLLQAIDSIGWEVLKKDFEIVEITPEERQAMGEDVYKRVCRSSVRLSPKSHPGAPVDKSTLSNNLVLGISREQRTVGLFHTNTEDEIHAVNIYKYHKNTKK